MVCTSLGSLLHPLFYFLCYIHFSLSVLWKTIKKATLFQLWTVSLLLGRPHVKLDGRPPGCRCCGVAAWLSIAHSVLGYAQTSAPSSPTRRLNSN